MKDMIELFLLFAVLDIASRHGGRAAVAVCLIIYLASELLSRGGKGAH